MHLTRAVITAAAPEQSALPLQRLIDRDGAEKTALQLIVEEVLDAGIDEIGLVICPGTQRSYEQAVGSHSGRLTFIEQNRPRGYGDALYRAREFVRDQPFLHLVGDHLYLNHEERRCVSQLVDVAREEHCAVSGVQATRESELAYFGTIGGIPVHNRPRRYVIHRVIEKPTPTLAEQELIVPGLRAGHYLCLFGMHVLTPAVMELLAAALRNAAEGTSISLSPSLSLLAQQERYLALEVHGSRYNIGVPYGLLTAQLAVALSGPDRDQILTTLVDLLAARR
jgi:UTP--glucose-1-phosphate uridylyltransferase